MEYSRIKLINKFFGNYEDAIENDLEKFNTIDPENPDYQMDYGTYMLTVLHCNQHS